MTSREELCTKSATTVLLDATAALILLTQKQETFSRIPAYLSRALNLPNLSLAIIHTVPDGAVVLLGAHSAGVKPATFEQDMLNIHAQTRPLAPQDGPTFRPITFEPADTDPALTPPRATVFAHAIDDRHRLILVVHQRADEQPLAECVTDALDVMSTRLTRMLEPLVIWISQPATLGDPFNRLTDREWMVLRGLSTDAGEKQLADQLGLSPHTLHSHIKSIYRKVGVQGRLPLLLRLEDALRELRLSRLETSTAGVNLPHRDTQNVAAS